MLGRRKAAPANRNWRQTTGARSHDLGRQPKPSPRKGPVAMTLTDDQRSDVQSLREAQPGGKPMIEGNKKRGEQVLLYIFVIVPFLALIAGVPLLWGRGIGWTDVVLSPRLLRHLRPRHHRRFPPLLHPRFVQSQPGPQDRVGHRRLTGHRRTGNPVGCRPSPAPRLLRPGRRPALAMALR